MTENEISRIVITQSIRIHRELGPGLLESVYQECLYYLLKKEGLKVVKEKALPLVFEEVRLDTAYRLDLLIEDKVVIELKSVEHISGLHYAQTLTYIKLGHYKLGLLINFNVPLLKDGIRRIVHNIDDDQKRF